MNPEGFFNYFGSLSLQSNALLNQLIANIFFDEVEHIKDATGLHIYIVYNPITLSTMQQMKRRGGNALGLSASTGPLTSKVPNLHRSKCTKNDYSFEYKPPLGPRTRYATNAFIHRQF